MKRFAWLFLVTVLLYEPLYFPVNSAASREGAVFATELNPTSFDQANAIWFENISTEQGLSQSTVTTILQDRLGFMWFGTEGGLNKYFQSTFVEGCQTEEVNPFSSRQPD